VGGGFVGGGGGGKSEKFFQPWANKNMKLIIFWMEGRNELSEGGNIQKKTRGD